MNDYILSVFWLFFEMLIGICDLVFFFLML